MEGIGMKSFIVAATLLSLLGCGGADKSTQTNATVNSCAAGQVCNGTQISYSGELTNVNHSVAYDIVKNVNGNIWDQGINLSVGTLNISSSPSSSNYFVSLTLYPRPSSWFVVCATVGGSCFNPVNISGMAYASGATLIMQVGGMKLVITPDAGNSDNAWNGTANTLNNIVIKVAKVGQDYTQAQFLANSNLVAAAVAGTGPIPTPYPGAGGPTPTPYSPYSNSGYKGNYNNGFYKSTFTFY